MDLFLFVCVNVCHGVQLLMEASRGYWIPSSFSKTKANSKMVLVQSLDHKSIHHSTHFFFLHIILKNVGSKIIIKSKVWSRFENMKNYYSQPQIESL